MMRCGNLYQQNIPFINLMALSALISPVGIALLHFVNLSIASEAELLDAVEHPDAHRDLVVRVWGYNAYFVDLDKPLQQHIIDRIMTQV